MTLREALMAVDLGKVYDFINKKDRKNVCKCDRPPLEYTLASYIPVVRELLSKPKTKPYVNSWLVREIPDWIGKKKYIEVCFLNPKYVAPEKGLKPYGCKRGEKPPEGHYNVNADKHQQAFAAGMTAWSKIIDTPIVIEIKAPLERVVAEILWEMTFYGWTEEKVEEKVEEIDNKIKIAMKEIKKGKYVELPSKKKGGLKIFIPDSVTKDIIDIANKSKKK